MIACGIKDICVGECILTKYPNGQYGSVIVDRVNIPERYIFAHENYGRQDNIKIFFPSDYHDQIMKIRREWDNEENTPITGIRANHRAYV